MPDDIIEEQVAELEVTVDPPDQEVDEASAFDEDESSSKEPVDEEPESTEPEVEKEETEGKDEKATITESQEDDDDIKRGRELLAAQKKAKEEQEAAKPPVDESKMTPQQKREARISAVLNESFDKDTIEKVILPSIPKNILPKEPITLADGTTMDFGEVVKDYPEMPALVAIIANNIMRQMAATGYLVSGEQYQSDIQRFGKTIDSRQMERTITHPVYGVPNAKEIVRSADFAPWMEKQPDEIKALFSSPDPFDRIKILKRFVNKGVLGEAKQQKEQAELKRVAAKKNFDAIHKTKKPVGSVKPTRSAMRPEDEEAEAFYSEDE